MGKYNIYLIILSIYVLVLGADVVKLIGLIRKPPLNFNINKYFYRIHIVVLICGVILSGLLIAFEVNFFNYSRPIAYAQHDEISLDDFNGFKLPGQTLQGGNEFAFIKTHIAYDIQSDLIDISAYFYPARSYVYIDDLQSDNLLRHEMYHFHITEVWARNFRKEVSELNHNPKQEELDEIYKRINNQAVLMQIAYDYDTDHSYLLGRQIEWQIKVDSMLTVLNPFEDRIIRF